MKLLGGGDLHIGAGHLTTLDDQRQALEHVCEIVEERGIQIVLLAGDTTHHARPAPEVLELIGSFFGRLDRAGAEVVIVAGNHDPQVPAVAQHFRGRIHAVYAPEPGGALPVIHLDGLDCAVLPWLPDRYVRAAEGGTLAKEEVAARLSFAARSILSGFRAQRRPGVPMVLVAHATVAGSETSTGWSMGFVPGTNWVIPVEDLAEFDVAIVGHIHRRQSPAANVLIPGSLLPLDFSETEEKGVTVVELWPSPAMAPDIEFVRIPTPQVCTFDIVGVAADPHDVGVAQLIDDATNYVDAGSLIRVRVHVDEARAREFPPARIERALLDAGARKVQVELTVEHPDRARDADMTAELLPLTALGRYLDGREDLDGPARDRVAAAATIALGDVQERQRATAGGDLDIEEIAAEDFIGIRSGCVRFDGQPVIVLAGPNGSGKSSLGVDTLRFALTGASRIGARPDPRLVREGADAAAATVTLRAADGRRVRVVRKLRLERGGRAVATSLDVLEASGDGWRPLSDGKVATGQQVLVELLGGLDDDTLVASTIAVQRAGDSFTRARREERKQLLARAAGLAIYDELALSTAKHLNEVEREIAALESQAETLRPRAEAVPRLEAELAAAERDRDAAAAAVKDLDRRYTEATDDLERATERATSYERDLETAKRIHGEVQQLDAERGTWTRKAGVAREILTQKAALLQARAELAAANDRLATARASVEQIGGELEEAHRIERTLAASQARAAEIERDLASLRTHREALGRAFDARLEEALRRRDELAQSGCLERCSHADGCTVAAQAAANERRIVEQQGGVEQHRFPTGQEHDLAGRIAIEKQTQHAPPPTEEISTRLTVARGAVVRIEREVVAIQKQTQVADKIAAAEAVLAEHAAAVARLDEQLTAKRAELGEANSRLVFTAGDPRAERARAAAKQQDLDEQLRTQRTTATEEGTRAAMLAGRLEELRAAATELAAVDERIRETATAAAAWKELVVAWRACRILTLETSLIPQVEHVANEVLRRFPHGIQLRLVTQRDRRSGDGQVETLDVEVQGRGELYEMCSGGERTAIDTACHIALAVVVSRRSATRLRFLVADEPEGLDEPSRAAFAGVVRWIAETYDLRVLVMSHAEDLVEQLGAQVIRIEGEAGNAHVGAAAAEPEAVSA